MRTFILPDGTAIQRHAFAVFIDAAGGLVCTARLRPNYAYARRKGANRIIYHCGDAQQTLILKGC